MVVACYHESQPFLSIIVIEGHARIMKAKNLTSAFNALDPRAPITPDKVNTLFVERVGSPARKMELQLRHGDNPRKLLFIGHPGSGKSSELAFLSRLLRDKFVSVFAKLYQFYDGSNVMPAEVLHAILLRLANQVTELEDDGQDQASPIVISHLRNLYNAIKQTAKRDELTSPMPTRRTPEVAARLKAWIVEIEAKIKTEARTRTDVQEWLEGREHELIENINDLCQSIEQQKNKRLLLVVEELDKFNIKNSRTLFLDHSTSLLAPRPSMIYTLQVEMRYQVEFPTLIQRFGSAHFLPNIAVRDRDGVEDSSGIKTLVEILGKRLALAQVFAGGLAERCAFLSGGHVRTLIQLAQEAILVALSRSHSLVEHDDVETAAQSLRNDFGLGLNASLRGRLWQRRQADNKSLEGPDEDLQKLLHNNSLLEYSNSDFWVDVMPLVEPLLKRVARDDDD